MKYQLLAPVRNVDSSPIKSPAGEPVTFQSVCVACLVQAQDQSASDKVAAFQLAVKIQTAVDMVELSAEEVARLKALIGAMMPVVVTGRMFQMLEQATQ